MDQNDDKQDHVYLSRVDYFNNSGPFSPPEKQIDIHSLSVHLPFTIRQLILDKFPNN